MDTWNFIFSFRGRIARQDFWLLTFVGFAMWFAFAILTLFSLPAVRWVLALILFSSGLAVWLSAATRRLHDRDKSAWYLLLFFGVPSALETAFAPHPKGYTVFVLFSGGTGSFIDLVCLAIGIWMIVELGCLRGTVGPNKYGPDLLSAPETQSV
jgi:uncharacterized membrane protein YhaH (DUF805 family)